MNYWKEFESYNLGRRAAHLLLFLKREAVYQRTRFVLAYDDDMHSILNCMERGIRDGRAQLLEKNLVRYKNHTYEILEEEEIEAVC